MTEATNVELPACITIVQKMRDTESSCALAPLTTNSNL